MSVAWEYALWSQKSCVTLSKEVNVSLYLSFFIFKRRRLLVPSFRVIVKMKWINPFQTANKSAQPTESTQWRAKIYWFSPPSGSSPPVHSILIKGSTIHSVVQARSPSHPWLFSIYFQSFSKTHWLPSNCVPCLPLQFSHCYHPTITGISLRDNMPYDQWYHTTVAAIFFLEKYTLNCITPFFNTLQWFSVTLKIKLELLVTAFLLPEFYPFISLIKDLLVIDLSYSANILCVVYLLVLLWCVFIFMYLPWVYVSQIWGTAFSIGENTSLIICL